MLIEELYLKSFGKFHEKKLCFKSGLNIIYGENGIGKTTIHSFIPAMLFGLSRQRGRAARGDLLRLYEPWDAAGGYGGRLTFHSGGRTFCVERKFSKEAKSAVMYCVDDGEELSIENGDLQQILGGLTEGAYYNTALIRQMKSETGQALGEELHRFMDQYGQTEDMEIDLPTTFQLLKQQEKRLLKEKEEVQKEIEQENEILLKKKQEIQTEIDSQKVKMKEYIEEIRQQEDNRICKIVKGMFGLGLCLAIAAILGTVFLRFQLGKFVFLYAIIVSLITIAVFCFARYLFVYGKNRRGKISSWADKKYGWLLKDMDEKISELYIKEGSCEEQHMEIVKKGMGQKVRELDIELEAINLAEFTLKQTAAEIRNEFGNQWNRRTTEIFQMITEEQYASVFSDEKMNMKISSDYKLLNIDQISKGTAEQLYFSMRLAAADMFFAEERMPIILDDAFAMYDDRKLGNLLKWLSDQELQVILFTCHKRESDILRQRKIPYNYIVLA